MVTRVDYVAALRTERVFVESLPLDDASKQRRLRDLDDELSRFDSEPKRIFGQRAETAGGK